MNDTGKTTSAITFKGKIGAWARFCKLHLVFLRRVMNDPETPRPARWLLRMAIVYPLSPIDLIPDWIPVIGLLDDVVIVSLLVYLAFRWVPSHIAARHRQVEITISEAIAQTTHA